MEYFSLDDVINYLYHNGNFEVIYFPDDVILDESNKEWIKGPVLKNQLPETLWNELTLTLDVKEFLPIWFDHIED